MSVELSFLGIPRNLTTAVLALAIGIGVALVLGAAMRTLFGRSLSAHSVDDQRPSGFRRGRDVPLLRRTGPSRRALQLHFVPGVDAVLRGRFSLPASHNHGLSREERVRRRGQPPHPAHPVRPSARARRLRPAPGDPRRARYLHRGDVRGPDGRHRSRSSIDACERDRGPHDPDRPSLQARRLGRARRAQGDRPRDVDPEHEDPDAGERDRRRSEREDHRGAGRQLFPAGARVHPALLRQRRVRAFSGR